MFFDCTYYNENMTDEELSKRNYFEIEKARKMFFSLADYYIAHSSNGWFELVYGGDALDVAERCSIKEGVTINFPESGTIEMRCYYGSRIERVWFYPISREFAVRLARIIDSSDFDESTTIAMFTCTYDY